MVLCYHRRHAPFLGGGVSVDVASLTIVGVADSLLADVGVVSDAVTSTVSVIKAVGVETVDDSVAVVDVRDAAVGVSTIEVGVAPKTMRAAGD